MENSSDTPQGDGKVVQLRPSADDGGRAFTRRWGANVADHGYTMVPSVFFALQAELALTSQQAMVLLHLLDRWWLSGSGFPWPSKKSLANRLSLSQRQVQRILTDLENEGLIKRLSRHYESGGQKSNAYDLTGLIDRLKELEPTYRKAREDQRARRARAEAPTRRRRAGSPRPAK